MIDAFLYVLRMQHPVWQAVIVVVFGLCFAAFMGGLLFIAEAAVDSTLGPVGLRLRLWKAKRAWKKRQRSNEHIVQVVGAYQQAQKELLARRPR